MTDAVVLDRYGRDVDEVVLTLGAVELWSKWGFRDGDWPDLEVGPVDPAWPSYAAGPDRNGGPNGEGWRDVLVVLVHRHLLPALDPVDRERIVVPDYGWGSHNPARVDTLDGEDYNTVHQDPPADMLARFEAVKVPLTRAQVTAAVEEVCGWAVST